MASLDILGTANNNIANAAGGILKALKSAVTLDLNGVMEGVGQAMGAGASSGAQPEGQAGNTLMNGELDKLFREKNSTQNDEQDDSFAMPAGMRA